MNRMHESRSFASVGPEAAYPSTHGFLQRNGRGGAVVSVGHRPVRILAPAWKGVPSGAEVDFHVVAGHKGEWVAVPAQPLDVLRATIPPVEPKPDPLDLELLLQRHVPLKGRVQKCWRYWRVEVPQPVGGRSYFKLDSAAVAKHNLTHLVNIEFFLSQRNGKIVILPEDVIKFSKSNSGKCGGWRLRMFDNISSEAPEDTQSRYASTLPAVSSDCKTVVPSVANHVGATPSKTHLPIVAAASDAPSATRPAPAAATPRAEPTPSAARPAPAAATPRAEPAPSTARPAPAAATPRAEPTPSTARPAPAAATPKAELAPSTVRPAPAAATPRAELAPSTTRPAPAAATPRAELAPSATRPALAAATPRAEPTPSTVRPAPAAATPKVVRIPKAALAGASATLASPAVAQPSSVTGNAKSPSTVTADAATTSFVGQLVGGQLERLVVGVGGTWLEYLPLASPPEDGVQGGWYKVELSGDGAQSGLERAERVREERGHPNAVGVLKAKVKRDVGTVELVGKRGFMVLRSGGKANLSERVVSEWQLRHGSPMSAWVVGTETSLRVLEDDVVQASVQAPRRAHGSGERPGEEREAAATAVASQPLEQKEPARSMAAATDEHDDEQDDEHDDEQDDEHDDEHDDEQDDEAEEEETEDVFPAAYSWVFGLEAWQKLRSDFQALEVKRLNLPMDGTKSDLTVSEAVARWVSGLTKGDIDEKTRTEYERYLALWTEVLGHVPVQGLLPQHLAQVLKVFRQTPTRRGTVRGTRSVRHFATALMTVLRHCVEHWYVLGTSPFANVVLPPAPPMRHRALTKEELGRLLEALKMSSSKQLVDLLLLSLCLGPRRSELCRLRWRHWNRERKQIVMEAALHKSGKRQKDEGKPLVFCVTGLAEEILKRRYEEAGRPSGETLVFPAPKGGKVYQPKRAYKTVLEAAGITDFTWHDLRHTTATWLAQDGVQHDVMMRILHHSHADMTHRYTALETKDLEGALKKVEERLLPVFGHKSRTK